VDWQHGRKYRQQREAYDQNEARDRHPIRTQTAKCIFP